MSEARHVCRTPPGAVDQKLGYGPAVTDCIEDDAGHFEVGNGEYGSFVNFCPFCGVKAPCAIPIEPSV